MKMKVFFVQTSGSKIRANSNLYQFTPLKINMVHLKMAGKDIPNLDTITFRIPFVELWGCVSCSFPHLNKQWPVQSNDFIALQDLAVFISMQIWANENRISPTFP